MSNQVEIDTWLRRCDGDRYDVASIDVDGAAASSSKQLGGTPKTEFLRR